MSKSNIFNEKEIERYSRHLSLSSFNIEQQFKLKNSKILVVGAGGLASPLLLYLASMGVGTIDIIDHDFVDSSNLQRQIVHNELSIGKNKAISAKEQITKLNRFIKVNAITQPFNESNCEFLQNYDLIAVTVDDYITRLLINKVSVKYGITQIVAGVVSYEGWVSVFEASTKDNPCYECFHFNLDKNHIKKAKDIGVFSPVVGILSTILCSEVARALLKIKNTLVRKIRIYDFLSNSFMDIKIVKNPKCKICN